MRTLINQQSLVAHYRSEIFYHPKRCWEVWSFWTIVGDFHLWCSLGLYKLPATVNEYYHLLSHFVNIDFISKMFYLQQQHGSADIMFHNRIAEIDWSMLVVLHLLDTASVHQENIFQSNRLQWHVIHLKWNHHRPMSVQYAVDSILWSHHWAVLA